jgi:hypothetical protein
MEFYAVVPQQFYFYKNQYLIIVLLKVEINIILNKIRDKFAKL